MPTPLPKLRITQPKDLPGLTRALNSLLQQLEDHLKAQAAIVQQLQAQAKVTK
jgi:hypothetical protein